MYIHIHIYIYTYIHIYIYTYIHIYICCKPYTANCGDCRAIIVHIYTHTSGRARAHTHTHTHMYTYIYIRYTANCGDSRAIIVQRQPRGGVHGLPLSKGECSQGLGFRVCGLGFGDLLTTELGYYYRTWLLYFLGSLTRRMLSAVLLTIFF